jgi:hypothetical protein
MNLKKYKALSNQGSTLISLCCSKYFQQIFYSSQNPEAHQNQINLQPSKFSCQNRRFFCEIKIFTNTSVNQNKS